MGDASTRTTTSLGPGLGTHIYQGHQFTWLVTLTATAGRYSVLHS